MADVFTVSTKDAKRIWISGCAAEGEPPLESKDGGKSFAPVHAAQGLFVFADEGSAIWAYAGNRHVYASHDGGSTWTPAGKPPRDFDRMQLIGARIWALSEFGAAFSDDGGKHWTEQAWKGAAFPEIFRPLVIAGDRAFAASVAHCALLVSDDGARSWNPIFSHDLVRVRDEDVFHNTCPLEHSVRSVAAASNGEVWAFVGSTLRKGAVRGGFRDVAEVPPDEPVSLAVTPHMLFAAGISTAHVFIRKRD
jgi:photosystem II stability/assembly factor-like uncharacterized protein